MIKTLVSIEADLVSSLAVRFACQLGECMDLEIQPVYVKESAPHDSSMGAGWASRTWEKQMVEEGKAEISELISTERDFCPILAEPRVLYGDRDAELLKIAHAEQFDIFIEGAHFAWTPSDIYKALRTKLYQTMPFPVILVRTLRKIGQVQLLCLDVNGTQTLTKVFQKLWKNCAVPLVLNYPGKDTAANGLREAVDQASKLLGESGCAVSVLDSLPLNPGADAAEAIKDWGLVAIAVEKTAKKDCSEVRWLSQVKTSSLLAFR